MKLRDPATTKLEDRAFELLSQHKLLTWDLVNRGEKVMREQGDAAYRQWLQQQMERVK